MALGEDFTFNRHLAQAAFKQTADTFQYLEIWKMSNEPPIVRKDALPDKLVRDWLYQKNSFSAPRDKNEQLPSGGFRLLIQRYRPEVNVGGLGSMPMSKETFLQILDALRLPHYWLDVFWNAQGTACTSFSDPINPTNGTVIIGSYFQSPNIWRQLCVLAHRHDFSSNLTTAYLGYEMTFDIDMALQYLLSSTAHACHPFLVPLVVLDVRMRGISMGMFGTKTRMLNLDRAVGMVDLPVSDPNYSAKNLDYDELNRELVNINSILLDGVLDSNGLMYDSVVAAFNKVENALSKSRVIWEEESQPLRLRIDLLEDRIKTLKLEHNRYASKLQLQSSVLYNLIAQRDNRLNISVAADSRRIAAASKRDSSAMKTISVMTVVFLPGTYIATIFGMDFFDVGASSVATKGSFWVYWAITVPLTLLVMLLWLLWLRRKQLYHRRKDQRVDKGFDEKLGKQP
ncbi:MAG: hypothetical protein M1835_005288 [Candelina submexicana]|nr:MAG: hypothetical protein M1835_005288 [Candelina submexicana]